MATLPPSEAASPLPLPTDMSSASRQPAHAPSSSDPPVPTQESIPVDSHRRLSRSSFSNLDRPSLGSRKSSGTIIIPRDSPNVEVKDEQYEEGDARAMSPRRGSDEIDRMVIGARAALEEQARILHANLMEIVERVETIKSEHEKLENGNKFLQSYIGELMQTSKITASGTGKSKQRPKNSKMK